MSEKQSDWKEKVQTALNTVQDELKKTTDIGVRMFSASKTNSCLKEAYEELGKITAREMSANRLDFDHPRARDLLQKIHDCERSLSSLEDELQDIRFKK